MTESKKIVLYKLADEELEITKEDIIKEPRFQLKQKIPVKEETDLIEKKRKLKKWRQSYNYYCLHPEKFRFSLRDLK